MSNISFEEKKKEAVSRMKSMKMFPEVIKQFSEDGLVMKTEGCLGGCYYLNDEQKKRVSDFEKKHNALVYHVIMAHTTDGIMESYIYVSDNKEDWASDHDDMNNRRLFAYNYVYDDPICSEFGAIGYRLSPGAGLQRLW